jgi:hypothetical protein
LFEASELQVNRNPVGSAAGDRIRDITQRIGRISTQIFLESPDAGFQASDKETASPHALLTYNGSSRGRHFSPLHSQRSENRKIGISECL